MAGKNKGAVTWKGTIFEDGSATVFAQIFKLATAPNERGSAYLQAEIASISYTVFDTAGAAIIGHDGVNLTVANVVFDTLQGWPEDSVGYNFKHEIANTAFPSGDVTAPVEYKITLASGTIGWLVVDVFAKAVQTS